MLLTYALSWRETSDNWLRATRYKFGSLKTLNKHKQQCQTCTFNDEVIGVTFFLTYVLQT